MSRKSRRGSPAARALASQNPKPLKVRKKRSMLEVNGGMILMGAQNPWSHLRIPRDPRAWGQRR